MHPFFHSLIYFKPDIPFKRDDSSRFMPWMIAWMVGLAALMLAIGLSLNDSVQDASTEQASTIDITIPHQMEEKQQTALREKTVALIESQVDIASIEPVSEADLRKAVAPWMGEIADAKALPLPTIIRVQPVDIELFDAEKLQKSLRELDTSIRVDGVNIWAAHYARAASLANWVLGFLIALMAAALAGMIIYISRTTLKLQHKTVLLLHTIGASDTYVARQFQLSAARLTLLGASIGTLVALILYAIIGGYFSSFDAALMPTLNFTFGHVLLLILLPLLASAIGFIAARIATLRYLGKFV